MNKKLNLNQLFSLGEILCYGFLTLIFTANNPVFAQNNNRQNTSLELAILQEINKARTNPIAYADLLETNFSLNDTNSQQENVDQAINFLGNLSPLPAIVNSRELEQVASAIVKENQTSNQVNSDYGLIDISLSGNDIKAQNIVLNLINQQNKQQRLFSGSTNITGIACSPTSRKCVMAYPEANQVAVTDSRVDRVLRENNSDSTSSDIPVTVRVSNPATMETETENNNLDLPITRNEEETDSAEMNDSQTVAATTQPYSLLERGSLQEGDLVIPSDGSLYDSYQWQGKAGDSLQITLESQDFDTYLAVQDAEGNIIAENDDANEGSSNSGLSIVLPADGTYRIIINSYDPSGRGDYTISVERR